MIQKQPSLCAEVSGERHAAIEIFGHALLDVLKCDRCYVAIIKRNGHHVLEEFKFGNGPIAPHYGPAVIEAISRQSVHESEWNSPIAEALLGPRPLAGAQAIFGRIQADPGKDLIFVAGWRTQPTSDLVLVRNSAGAIWTSIRQASAVRDIRSGEALIMTLAHPAFVVDFRLHLHCTNAAGQQLLAEGRLLRSDRQTLACGNATADLMLRQLMAGLREGSSELEDQTQVVPLISQPDSFAFACIGTVLNALHDGLAIVIVPQLEKAAATKRLSSLFALTGMDERIVAQILEGHPPRRVGKTLNLTEATVRTYTKRLMFKLGIKRRSDLFRLAFLTAPPIVLNQFGQFGFNFRTGLGEKTLQQPPVRERLHPSRRVIP